MIVAVADTHAVIWYLYADSRLSVTARATIDNAAQQGNQVAISSITLAEIVYLAEKGRIAPATLALTLAELNATTSVLTEIPMDQHVITAMSTIQRQDVPELADRIIAATALMLKVPVISRDSKIRSSNITTIWE
mgnify:CR=1 FL=1